MSIAAAVSIDLQSKHSESLPVESRLGIIKRLALDSFVRREVTMQMGFL